MKQMDIPLLPRDLIQFTEPFRKEGVCVSAGALHVNIIDPTVG